ncbi:MAG: DNA polymerase IV [Arcobacter sp.]|uniref:DNA polymerase Y family protein n=1 Tax=uncultured Arcobacter sp. TaxID=165434 RepID=UPI000CAAAAF9|nr:DNA polymerase IV [uncultured Arcobacter sp.]PLY09309.1 MAG: DNA polymerase IV [Arcobacter sp.]
MILHLDIDCFFVSAHRTRDKSLMNIPTAVGGRSNLNIFSKSKHKRVVSDSNGAFVSSIVSEQDPNAQEYFKDENGRIRGIITTSSYEARAFGVKTAMSVNEALRLCPHLKMIAPNYPLYHELSYKLLQFLEYETPQVEQFSIDEYFADVTGWVEDKDVEIFAKRLKDKIEKIFDLPISIGVAKSKYLSKLATEYAKPHGVKVVFEDEVNDFIKDIPIEKFPGIGQGYQMRLRAHNIKTLGQIREKKHIFYAWKKPGIQLYNRVCGIKDFVLEKKAASKSIGIGRSFDPINNREEIKRRIIILARYLAFLVFKKRVNPQTFFIKIKYEFDSKSKSSFSTNRLFSEKFFKDEIIKMFNANDIHPTHSIIQLNITVSNFMEQKMDSFNLLEYENDLKKKQLNNKLNELRDKFGVDIIKNATEL